MKKSRNYDAINHQLRINYEKFTTSRGIFELSLPLVFSIWCIVFLCYSELGFILANEGNIEARNERTSVNVCNTKNCDPAYSCVKDSKEKTINRLLLQFNILVDFEDSNNHNCCDENLKYFDKGRSDLEDVVWSFIDYPSFICPIEPQIEQEQKPIELAHDGKNRLAYLNLEEFRNITKQVKGVSESSQLVNITHRLEPDGTEYNYASASKGAKVVTHNKEAKGANNILGKDHDKYLRNPCSIKEKFVIIELTEETLVDAVKIANFEHYSSNFKDFELFGSLIYPTDKWVPLGKFVAANVKHAQCFKLGEPKWVRYLKLNLFTHYGSGFYCTLSVVEVYGIDAIERMLEDLIVDSEDSGPKELPNSNSTLIPILVPEMDNNDPKISGELEKVNENNGEEKSDEGSTTTIDVKLQKSGRIHADAVLKILMQKVRSLEINLSVLEEYIKEMNRRQGDLIPDMEKELARYSKLLEKSRTDVKDLLEWKEIMDKGVNEIKSWKDVVSPRIDALIRENDMLRSDVEKVVTDQSNLEKKEIVVLVVSFCFAFFAILKLISEMIFLGISLSGKVVYRASKGWILMLISCCMTILIILLGC